MRHTQDYTGSFATAPESYALQLVKQGFSALEYWTQARDTQPIEYIEAVMFELGQLPTTEEWYKW